MKRYTGLIVVTLLLSALSVRAQQNDQAPLDLKAAIGLAQSEAGGVYGPVTYKSGEAYAGLDGAPAAWALEFSSAQWQTVSALVIPGTGVQEPAVKLWRGQPIHQDAAILAAAALAVHDGLGIKVTLPAKILWLGRDAVWAVYPELNPQTGQPAACNLLTRQVGAPGAARPAAKATLQSILPLFGGSVDYPSDEDITWLRGQTYAIEWSDFDGDQVVIELYKGMALKSSRTTDNDGSTNWTVDKDIALGSDYRICIRSKSNPLEADWSDDDFTIASGTRHVVTPSDSGITWKRGQTYDVRWEGFSGSEVKLELYLGPLRIDSHTTVNDGRYSWTVDDSLISSPDYKFKISETDNDSRYDWSDKSFKITGAAVKVTYPTASGITWYRGKKYTVKWSGFGGDQVLIGLYKGGTLKASKVVDNSGSAGWTVSGSQATGSDYKILITSVGYPWQTDESDKSFKISK